MKRDAINAMATLFIILGVVYSVILIQNFMDLLENDFYSVPALEEKRLTSFEEYCQPDYLFPWDRETEAKGGRITVYQSGHIEFSCFDIKLDKDDPFEMRQYALDAPKLAEKAMDRLSRCAYTKDCSHSIFLLNHFETDDDFAIYSPGDYLFVSAVSVKPSLLKPVEE